MRLTNTSLIASVGISKLSWAFNGESGDFELVPGNPYFYKEIDTRKISGKSTVFTVTAVDTLGNTVVVPVVKSVALRLIEKLDLN